MRFGMTISLEELSQIVIHFGATATKERNDAYTKIESTATIADLSDGVTKALLIVAVPRTHKLFLSLVKKAWDMLSKQPDDSNDELLRLELWLGNLLEMDECGLFCSDRSSCLRALLNRRQFVFLSKCGWPAILNQENCALIVDQCLAGIQKNQKSASHWTMLDLVCDVARLNASLRDRVLLTSMCQNEHIKDVLRYIAHCSVAEQIDVLLNMDPLLPQLPALVTTVINHSDLMKEPRRLGNLADFLSVIMTVAKKSAEIARTVLKQAQRSQLLQDAHLYAQDVELSQWMATLESTLTLALTDKVAVKSECDTVRQQLRQFDTLIISQRLSRGVHVILSKSPPKLYFVDEFDNIVECMTLEEYSANALLPVLTFVSEPLLLTLANATTPKPCIVELQQGISHATWKFTLQYNSVKLCAGFDAKPSTLPLHRGTFACTPDLGLYLTSRVWPRQLHFMLERIRLLPTLDRIDLSQLVGMDGNLSSVFDALRKCLNRSKVTSVADVVLPESWDADDVITFIDKVLGDEVAATVRSLKVSCQPTPPGNRWHAFLASIRRCKSVTQEHFTLNISDMLLKMAADDIVRGNVLVYNVAVCDAASDSGCISEAQLDENDIVEIPNEKVAPTMLCGAPSMKQYVDLAPNATQTAPHLWALNQALWRLGKGVGIRVAILDGGVDISHERLRSRVVACKSFVAKRHAWLDDTGHGTYCASVIAGDGIGIAPDCSLFVGRVIGDNGVGTVESLVRGIEWAIECKCQIISLSVGTDSCDDSLRDVIARAQAAHAHVICAAANVGQMGQTNIAYPARFGNVICVGSSDASGHASRFSSCGREIDFLAFGENVVASGPNNSYLMLSGTSVAVPSVAGLIAVLLSHFATTLVRPLRCAEMKALLVQMCAHTGTHTQTDGYGLLQLGQSGQRFLRANWLSETLRDVLHVELDVGVLVKKTKAALKLAAEKKAERVEAVRVEDVVTKFRATDGYKALVDLAQQIDADNVLELIPVGQRCDEFDNCINAVKQGLNSDAINNDDDDGGDDDDSDDDTVSHALLRNEYQFDLGFENAIVSLPERDSLLTSAAEFFQSTTLDEAQFDAKCDMALQPLEAVKFKKIIPVHFGYAVVFIQARRDQQEVRFTLLMGAANGDIKMKGDVAARSNKESASSAHTEKRILNRLFMLLVWMRRHDIRLEDIFIHFFTQKPICHTCRMHLANFFASLEIARLLTCQKARFGCNERVPE